jgi:hypothetical protein
MRYLLVTFLRKPGGRIDEQAGFSKVIKQKDLGECNVILDYQEQKVVKCVIEGKVVPTSFESMHEYYKKVYPNMITQMEHFQMDKLKDKFK